MKDQFDFRGRFYLGSVDPQAAAVVKQARRDYCEDNDHSIHRKFLQRNAKGEIVVSVYACDNCDVKVELSYPEE